MRPTAPGQNHYTSTTSDNSNNGTDADGQSLAAQAMQRTSQRIQLLKEIDIALMHSHEELYPLLAKALAKVKS